MSKEGVKFTPVLKYKDCLVPESYLASALIECTAFGAAAALDGETVSLIRQSVSSPDEALKEILELQERLKGHDVLMCFCKLPKGVTDEDIQPFRLVLKDQDNAVIVGALSGNFDDGENKSSKTDEWFTCMGEGGLGPELYELWKENGQDLTKTVAAIQSKKFSRYLFGLAINGSIALLAAKGTEEGPLVIDPNKQYHDFSWGSTTDPFDYTEETQKEETPVTAKSEAPKEPEKPKSMAEKMLGKAAAPTTTAKPAASVPATGEKKELSAAERRQARLAAQKEQEAEPAKTKPAETETPKEGETEDVKVYPPKEIKSWDDLRVWYQKHSDNGKYPHNYKDRPPILMKRTKTVDTVMADRMREATIRKNTEAAHIPHLPKEMPFLTVEDKKRAESFFNGRGKQAGTVDISSKAVMDPIYAKVLEDNSPTFEDETGHKVEELINLPWEHMVKFCGNDRVAAMALKAAFRLVAKMASGVKEEKPSEETATPVAMSAAQRRMAALAAQRKAG